VSEQRVLLGTVKTRIGNTWYAATGNLWWVAVMVALLLASWAPDVRRRIRVRRERESESAVRPR
jgi:apolipoprotein N-acyltransferase